MRRLFVTEVCSVLFKCKCVHVEVQACGLCMRHDVLAGNCTVAASYVQRARQNSDATTQTQH